MSFFEAATNSLSELVKSGTASMATDIDRDNSTKVEFWMNTDATVWILGQSYSSEKRDRIKDVIRSRLWMTYRHDFPEIGNSALSSDRGWGCMLRCGQMVVAEALVRLHLGKNWTWQENCNEQKYLRILGLFNDMNKNAPYSIHQIALMGESTDQKPVGTWFGPNTVAHALKKLSSYDEENCLNIHVAMDNIVVIDEISDSSKTENQGLNPNWKPLLLFIPLRLGLSDVNPNYYNDLKECFEFPQSVGVIGGRPNHALYFIGYVEDELVFLDPHTSQPAGNVGQNKSEFERVIDQTFHSERADRLDMINLDPSLSLCFFCKDESEFEDLCEKLLQRLVRGHTTPLFEICRQRPSHMKSDSNDVLKSGTGGAEGETIEKRKSFDTSDDEFEIL